MKEYYKQVYQFYTDFFIKTGRFPSYDDIATHFNCTRENIRQTMNRMERYGLCYKPRRSSVPWFFHRDKLDK